jgi:hypothetical protein
MDTSPSVNSSIRAALIAVGAVGVSKGWWDQAGLEGLVDHLIVFGGAALAIGAFAWGLWAKRPQSKEAQKIADTVDSGGRL